MHSIDKGGRPEKYLAENDVIQIEALAAMCTKGQIADYFGMTEKTFRAIEHRQPEVFTAYRKGKARAIAEVGSALYQKALDGDIRAMQFYLKTQAGWTEKHALEVSQSDLETDERKWLVEVIGSNG
jgi:predicted transcriptional regulator